ncbi:hypothetical protein SAVERM_5117 [Streptomyces avermitilis MA-4680 = NBRC 14893]|uniref:Uncharacterized protein n=1 Tax=Streptomyces avermitilis (strain ATCC 31267 / DSM 46492 / JCM 5070 / NBRC 14893 / NCIMB 12804 / NRRL 8165 / MA-4680) TaxID=227882 RepID=Q82D67_STRAW|nr:hypothetical protein SAVERM_5117 [Streptomyces avermitilis MA-4680 = NBRC 14893]
MIRSPDCVENSKLVEYLPSEVETVRQCPSTSLPTRLNCRSTHSGIKPNQKRKGTGKATRNKHTHARASIRKSWHAPPASRRPTSRVVPFGAVRFSTTGQSFDYVDGPVPQRLDTVRLDSQLRQADPHHVDDQPGLPPAERSAGAPMKTRHPTGGSARKTERAKTTADPTRTDWKIDMKADGP